MEKEKTKHTITYCEDCDWCLEIDSPNGGYVTCPTCGTAPIQTRYFEAEDVATIFKSIKNKHTNALHPSYGTDGQ